MALVATTFVVVACAGRALDIGGNLDASDAATPEIPLPETGPELPPVGFYASGTPCTILSESVSGHSWPTWSMSVEAMCGLRRLDVGIVSNATIAYPQSCSIATSVSATVMDTDGGSGLFDGGGVPAFSLGANALGGSCTIMVGPTTDMPSTAIALEARLESIGYDPGSSDALELSYRSPKAN